MESITFFILSSAILLLCVFAATRMFWLTPNGAIAAWATGACIVSAGGWMYLVPMLVFFIAGSLSGSLHKKGGQKSGRNAIQVLTNGGVAGLCILAYGLTGHQIFEVAYLVSVGISLTDTLSGDIGIASGKIPFDIITLKPVDPGMSGGISFGGTAGGIGVSVLFGLMCYFLFDISMADLYIIAVFGTAGMVADSVLGSLYQAKYMDSGTLTESPENNAVLVRGQRWMTNEMVNLLSNLLLTACSLAAAGWLI